MMNQQINDGKSEMYDHQVAELSQTYEMVVRPEQRKLLKKFLKKPRRSRCISEDPISSLPLNDHGNKLRAERKKLKM